MERNGTKRNRIKSFATPAHSYEANQGHHQGRLAHRVRVSGVPNEGSAKLGHGLAHSHEVNTQAAWVLTSQRGQPLVDVAGSPTGAASQLDALRELADLL